MEMLKVFNCGVVRDIAVCDEKMKLCGGRIAFRSGLDDADLSTLPCVFADRCNRDVKNPILKPEDTILLSQEIHFDGIGGV